MSCHAKKHGAQKLKDEYNGKEKIDNESNMTKNQPCELMMRGLRRQITKTSKTHHLFLGSAARECRPCLCFRHRANNRSLEAGESHEDLNKGEDKKLRTDDNGTVEARFYYAR